MLFPRSVTPETRRKAKRLQHQETKRLTRFISSGCLACLKWRKLVAFFPWKLGNKYQENETQLHMFGETTISHVIQYIYIYTYDFTEIHCGFPIRTILGSGPQGEFCCYTSTKTSCIHASPPCSNINPLGVKDHFLKN